MEFSVGIPEKSGDIGLANAIHQHLLRELRDTGGSTRLRPGKLRVHEIDITAVITSGVIRLHGQSLHTGNIDREDFPGIFSGEMLLLVEKLSVSENRQREICIYRRTAIRVQNSAEGLISAV